MSFIISGGFTNKDFNTCSQILTNSRLKVYSGEKYLKIFGVEVEEDTYEEDELTTILMRISTTKFQTMGRRGVCSEKQNDKDCDILKIYCDKERYNIYQIANICRMFKDASSLALNHKRVLKEALQLLVGIKIERGATIYSMGYLLDTLEDMMSEKIVFAKFKLLKVKKNDYRYDTILRFSNTYM
jgi:hypothetical protein